MAALDDDRVSASFRPYDADRGGNDVEPNAGEQPPQIERAWRLEERETRATGKAEQSTGRHKGSTARGTTSLGSWRMVDRPWESWSPGGMGIIHDRLRRR